MRNILQPRKLKEPALQGAVQRYGIEFPKGISDRINMEFSVFGSQDVLKELRFLSPVSLSLLSPSSLDIISLCLKELQIYRGISLDLNTVSLNDRKVRDFFLDPSFEVPICWSEAMKSRLSAIGNYIFTDIVTARTAPEYHKSKVYEMCWARYHHAYLMTYYPEEYRKAAELAEQIKVRNTVSFEYEVALKKYKE